MRDKVITVVDDMVVSNLNTYTSIVHLMKFKVDEGIFIDESFKVKDLSYNDYGDYAVEVLLNGKLVDQGIVWRDSEMDGREYIIINHTIYYLDTIKKN